MCLQLILNKIHVICLYFTEADSLFKTGWFDLKEEWNNPAILHTVEPVFDIRDHLHDIITQDKAMEYDLTIYASQQLYRKLLVSNY